MLGKPVADFSLPATGNTMFRLSGTRGGKVVLYFYPKDNTPGCTQQGSDFRDQYAHFSKAKCRIYGISRDSLKNMYGRKVRGIVRSTFLVDDKGVLAREWRGVKVPGHVQEVLNFVKAL
jgi:peroxiredoxin Q/BCP